MPTTTIEEPDKYSLTDVILNGLCSNELSKIQNCNLGPQTLN